MKRATLTQKAERVEHANALIRIISDYGRRFFYDSGSERVARMLISKRGHIYFQDDYTGKLIYVAYSGRWSGFSHGGTLKGLVERLADYVRTGRRLSIDWIGPERFDQSNIWGYAEDEMLKCRAAAMACEAVQPCQ